MGVDGALRKQTVYLSVCCDFSTRTLKSLCGKHRRVRCVAFTRAGPADRRQLETITEAGPVDSTVRYQMHPLYQALSASARRPAQGVCVCVRNREEGVWGGNLHLSPVWL